MACRSLPAPSWGSRGLLKASLGEFAALYARRPLKRNPGGMSVNHAFALWFTMRALLPPVLIESGVHRGFGTWLARETLGPTARIFSLDPESRSVLDSGFVDPSATYLVGSQFTDFGEVDWARLIPRDDDRAAALIILDDHMSAVKRAAQAIAFGFRHVWYDDNAARSPKADCYSFSAICAEPNHTMRGREPSQFRYRDMFGRVSISIPRAEHDDNLRFLLAHVEEYFEFPPVIDGCELGGSKVAERVALATKAEAVQLLGMPLPRLVVLANRHRYVTDRASRYSSNETVRALETGALLSFYPPYVHLAPYVNLTLLRRTTAHRLEHAARYPRRPAVAAPRANSSAAK